MPHVLGALLKEVGTVVADGDAAGGKGGDDAGRQTSSQQQLKDEKDVRADRGKREKDKDKKDKHEKDSGAVKEICSQNVWPRINSN